MAVDTRNKRASVVNFAAPWCNVLPVADSSVDQGDRQQLLWVYRGILAEETEPEGVGSVIQAKWSRGTTTAAEWARSTTTSGKWSK